MKDPNVVTSLELPLALTQGDPAGIGPDIALAAWARRDELNVPPFLFVGDPDVLTSRANILGIPVNIVTCEAEEAVSAFTTGLPVLPVPVGFDVQAGQPHVGTAISTIKAIETAVSLTMARKAAAVVTNPIAKPCFTKPASASPATQNSLRISRSSTQARQRDRS